MDTMKKAELEKRAVLALGAVFVMTLFMGPLKHLVSFNRRPASSPKPAAQAPGSTQVGMETDVPLPVAQASEDADSTKTSQVAARTTGYSAQTVRDPLKSLLPVPEDPLSVPAIDMAASQPSPPPEAAPRPPALRLQGLVWGGEAPRAIINDEVYRVGDTVEGAVIRSIVSGTVTVEFEGTTFSLYTKREWFDQPERVDTSSQRALAVDVGRLLANQNEKSASVPARRPKSSPSSAQPPPF